MTDSTRRRLLHAGIGTLTVTVAGCADDADGGPTTSPASTPTETTTGASPEPTPSGPNPALSVDDQTTDGSQVTVASAAIDGSGWLVIHPEAEDGGGPNGGVVLGSRQLEVGTYTDVTLELDPAASSDQTLYAMLHYDDPADDEFTFPSDGDPPVTADGGPVITPFTLTVSGDDGGPTPALSVADQTTDGSRVTVASAAIDGPGWLVIHPEADGGGPNGGAVLASRQLSAGTYSDLTLELDSPASSDQTLYAMLHYDHPADGEFTFPSDGDPAVTTNGNPVVTPFDLTVGATTTATDDGGMATVTLENSAFDPKRLSIDPGTTVEWINEDGYGHDVTSAQFTDAATAWDYQESLSGGDSVTRTFEESGVYEYYCTIHGRSNMCGVVLVGDVSHDADLPCESDDGGGGY
jgi:plastocyanin